MRGVITIAALSAILVSPSTSIAQAIVEWGSSFDEALETARARSDTVLLDFSADWCPPCKEMDEKVWTDPDLAALVREKVVPVRIDFDEEKRLVRRFKVSSIPTIIWADPWGNELGRHVGYEVVATLVEAIESMPEDFRAIQSFHEIASKDDEPAVPLVRIGSFYRAKGFLLAAESFYERALDACENGKREPQAAEQAYVGLGLSLLSRGKAAEARKAFERAVKLPPGPNRANALYGLVAAYARLGDEKKAAQRLCRAEVRPSDLPEPGGG